MDADPHDLKGITSRTTYGQMRRQADNLDVTVASAHLPGNIERCYDQNTNMILIDRTMTYTQKRCTLLHELIHWAHRDTSLGGIYDTHIEHRTRRETALKLVDPLEYRTAETMYEGDAYQIACELNVTLQLIKDYQRILEEQQVLFPYRYGPEWGVEMRLTQPTGSLNTSKRYSIDAEGA